MRFLKLLGGAVAAAILATAPLAASAAPEPALVARSEVKGVSLVRLRTLPRSPENGSLDDFCTQYRAEKLTAVGRQVAKLGWIVTSEAPLGRYRVVSFASGFDPGTSAICYARNSNIAVFDGPQLVALAYPRRPKDAALATVELLESGALLVWTDPPGGPIGELRQGSQGLRMTPVAAERTFCHGRAIVPNVYGKPIGDARKVLMAQGWRPVRPREAPGPYSLARDLVRQGVIEVEDCSGTGVGYCAFNYRGPAGRLSVTTASEEPSVVAYSVECRAK